MILIVEDDPQVARLIVLVLQRHGYRGEIVSDGKVALDKIKKEKPEAIFADLTIRGMGGEALCVSLKRDPELGKIPFIILSGDRDIAEKARSCGADDHLGKPFEFDDLIRLVKKYAERNQ